MISATSILPIIKYIVIIAIFICIVLTPAYLAAANSRSKLDCARTRCASWLFGWSFIGWLVALFVSAKK